MSKLSGNRIARRILARVVPVLWSMPVIGFATFGYAAETCIEYPYSGVETAEKSDPASIYEGISFALDYFPSFARTLNNAAPDLCFSSSMDGALGYLDVGKNRIVISEGLPDGLRNGVFLHELRHLEQFANGSCPADNLAMEEYARATFAMEADASAISLLVAWKLKENGQRSIWAALSSWPQQADIAAGFADEMADSNDIALAVSVAFYQWYASNTRVEKYYFSTCSDYLDRQDEGHIIPQYQMIPDTFLKELCILPDGRRYACSPPEVRLR